MENNFGILILYNKTRLREDGTRQVITFINKQNIGAPSKTVMISLLQFSEYMD